MKKIHYILIGSVFVLFASLVTIFILPSPTNIQVYVLAICLAIGSSAVVIALPGTIQVDWPKGIHATGSFAVFAIVLFSTVSLTRSDCSFYNVKGKIVVNDSAGNKNIFNNLDIVVMPPKLETYEMGEYSFVIRNVPIDNNEKDIPRIIILKEGYEREYVLLQENKKSDQQNPYLITLQGQDLVVDSKTPIILKRLAVANESVRAGMPDYSEDNAVNVATPVADNGN